MSLFNDIYDVIVIGTGPGGEGAAMKATKSGKRVAVIEKYASRWSSIGNLKILISILTVAIIGFYAPSEIMISDVVKKVDKSEIILPMIYGILLYLCIEFLRGILEDDGTKHETNSMETEREKIEHVANSKLTKGGFASFVYLELIDMSFSFDGVL